MRFRMFRSRALRRRWLLLATLVLVLGLWSCFPGPVRELWPPPAGETRHDIEVVFHDWHTVIVLPRSNGNVGEWEFCEEGWYLDGHQGPTGVVRALLWPTASAVARRVKADPPWVRHSGEEVEHWSFVLSDAGLLQMLAYLEAEVGEPLEDHPGWYSGKRSYHFFYSCHHFTASALRAAGLPIRPWWAFSGWMVGLQLDRVEAFHEEEIE